MHSFFNFLHLPYSLKLQLRWREVELNSPVKPGEQGRLEGRPKGFRGLQGCSEGKARGPGKLPDVSPWPSSFLILLTMFELCKIGNVLPRLFASRDHFEWLCFLADSVFQH